MSARQYRRVDEIPSEPGEYAIRMCQVRNPQPAAPLRGPYLLFVCPLGRGGTVGALCGVPLVPSPPNSRGCSWQWNGDVDAPTLSPSINCNGEGACGWHGWVERGVFRDA